MIEHDELPERPAGERWSATDAANFVFEQFIDEAAPATTATGDVRQGSGESGAPTPPSVGGLRIRSSLARSVDLYTDLFQRFVSSFISEMTETLTAAATGAEQPVPVIMVGRPGSTTGAFVWIHNRSGALVTEFGLRMTDLSTADGGRVSSALATIDPDRLEPSSESRRSAWLTVSVPEDAGRGTYHGHLLAEGLPDAAVALRLVVQ